MRTHAWVRQADGDGGPHFAPLTRTGDRLPPSPRFESMDETQRRLSHTLWRLRGITDRVVTAQLSTHPESQGWELRVVYEPDGLLESRIEKDDVSALTDRAESVRTELINGGWRPVFTKRPTAH